MITVNESPSAPHPSASIESPGPIPPPSEDGLRSSLAGIANKPAISSLLSPLIGLFRDVPAGAPMLPPDDEDFLVMRVANAQRADVPQAPPSSTGTYAMSCLASWANEALVASVLGKLAGDLPHGVVMPGGLLHALWRADFASGLLHTLSLLPTHVMPEQMVTDVPHAIRAYVLDFLGPSGRWIVGEGGGQENDYLGSVVLVTSIALAIAHHANIFGRPGANPKRAGEKIVDGVVAMARGLLSLRGFVQALLSKDQDIADRAIGALREQATVARKAYEASGNANLTDTEVHRALRREYLETEIRLQIAELDKSIASTTDPNLIRVLTNDRDLLEGSLRRKEPKTQEWRAEQRASRGPGPDPRRYTTKSSPGAQRIAQQVGFAQPCGLTDVGVFPPEERSPPSWGAAAARPTILARPSSGDLVVSRKLDAVEDFSNRETSSGESGSGSGERTCIDLTDHGIALGCPAPVTGFIAPRSKKSGAAQTGIDTSQAARQAAVAAAGGAALGVDGTTELVVEITGAHSLEPWRSGWPYHATLDQILGGNVWETIREKMREGELTVSYAIPGKDKGSLAYRSFFEAMADATVIGPESPQDAVRVALPEKILYAPGILDVVDIHAGQLPHLAFMYPFATLLPEVLAEEARLKADYEKYEAEITRLSMSSYGDWQANDLLEKNRELRDDTGVLWRALSQRISRLQDQAQCKVIAQYISEAAYNVVGRFPPFDLLAGKAVRIEIAYVDGSRQIRAVEIEEPFRDASDWQAQVANATNGNGELVVGWLRANGWVVPSFFMAEPNVFRVPHGSSIIDVSVTEMDSPRCLSTEWSRLSLRNLSLVYETNVARDSMTRLDTAIHGHQAVLSAGDRRPVESIAKKYRDKIALLRRLRQSRVEQLEALAVSMTLSRAAITALEARMVAASIPPVRGRGEERGVQAALGEVVLGINTSIETVEKTGLSSIDAVLRIALDEALGAAHGSEVSIDTKYRFTYVHKSISHGNFESVTRRTRLYSIREIMLGVVNREESAVDTGHFASDGSVEPESGHLPEAVGRFLKKCVSVGAARNHPRSRVAEILEGRVRELGTNSRLKKQYTEFSRQRLYGIVQKIAHTGGDAAQLAMLWLSGVVDPRPVMFMGQVVPGVVAIGSDEMSLLVSLESGRSVIFQLTVPTPDLPAFIRSHLSLFDQADHDR